jgi:hypothetical protein
LKDKILNRDESYFNNPDNHTKDAEEAANYIKNQNPLDEIIRLQGIYKQLSKDSKENVWDMTQAMLIIAMEYIELKK